MCKSFVESTTKSTQQKIVQTLQCTELGFASFLSGGYITAIVVNPPENKLAKRTSVQCAYGVAMKPIFLFSTGKKI